jgi:3-hydroxyacyl-CoA dehydrogenase
MTFDLQRHLAQIRDGKAELEHRRDELRSEIQEKTEELEDVESDLERIKAMDLDSMLGPEPQRMSGVLPLVDSVAVEMLCRSDTATSLAEDVILEEVIKREPAAKPGSVRSALRRLVDKGRLVRSGKRGAYFYALGQPESGSPPVPDANSLRESVVRALEEAGEGGLTRKQLSWTAGDVATVDRMLADPDIIVETFEHEGEQRYRLKPRQPEQKKLFQGADDPPGHA